MAADEPSGEGGYRLSRPALPSEWQAYRDIRRSVHFEDEDEAAPPPDYEATLQALRR